MHLTQPLHKALQECPDAVATVYGDRRRTYSQLVDRVSRLAAALAELGIREGDRVAMLSLHSDRYVEYVYGVLWAGAVASPLNTRWSPAEITQALDDAGAALLLVDDNFAPMLDELRERAASGFTVVFVGEGQPPAGALDYEALIADTAPQADANRGGDDLAALIYTGGTTGTPKGVMLSHTFFYVGSLGSLTAAPRPPRSVGLQAAPPFHVAGFQAIIQLSMRLGRHVILPSFEPGAVLEIVEREGVMEMFLVPTMLRALLDHADFPRRDLSSLRYLRYGASPMDRTLLERALSALPDAEISQAYGMTEISPVSILPADCHRPDSGVTGKLSSAGRPISIAEVRIVDQQGRGVGIGEVGEIVARGPMMMQGYWNQPELTAEAVREGWMHTGDAGFMDADGFIHVVDRIKDMIVTGGENVYSAEVESVLLQLPQVAQCAVIGVPDSHWGERVHAVLVLKEGMSLEYDELASHCKALIAGYKCPRSMDVVEDMPLSGAGKLLKSRLREPYWRGSERFPSLQ